jgi:hypothetical protein
MPEALDCRAATPELIVVAQNSNSESSSPQTQFILTNFLSFANRCIESPLVCRRPRSKDTGLWKRTNVETDVHLKCASGLCGWFSSIRAILTVNLRRSDRLRPRLGVGLIPLHQVGMPGCMTPSQQNFQTSGCSIDEGQCQQIVLARGPEASSSQRALR